MRPRSLGIAGQLLICWARANLCQAVSDFFRFQYLLLLKLKMRYDGYEKRIESLHLVRL